MEKRSGFRKKKTTESVVMLDKKMWHDPRGIYMVNVTIKYGSDKEFAHWGTYCKIQHDFSISGFIRQFNLLNRAIKSVYLKPIKRIGDSIADESKIKKWSKVEDEKGQSLL